MAHRDKIGEEIGEETGEEDDYRDEETINRLKGLRKDATRTVCFRMYPSQVEELQTIADSRGLKLSQLVKSWVTEKLNSTG